METVTAGSKYKHKIDFEMLNKSEQTCGDGFWGLFYFKWSVTLFSRTTQKHT